MLKCIEVGISPVRCILKKHMTILKGYHVDKQLLQERDRNVNDTLHLWELKRQEYYSKIRNLIQDSKLTQCILLINKIKDFRQNKTKLRQMDKFNRLYDKLLGYMYNNSSFSTFGGHRLFGGNSNNRNTLDISTPTTTATLAQSSTATTTSNKWVINVFSTTSPKCQKLFWSDALTLHLS